MVYDLEALRREYQQGQRYKFLFFWGHQPQADGLPEPVVALPLYGGGDLLHLRRAVHDGGKGPALWR